MDVLKRDISRWQEVLSEFACERVVDWGCRQAVRVELSRTSAGFGRFFLSFP